MSDYSELQALINNGSGTTVTLPVRTYAINNILSLSVNNTIIRSAGRTIIQTNGPIAMQVGNDINNVRLEGIDFVCTGVGANVEGYYGLFTSNLKSINGLTFSNCSFQSSQTITNGIKLIADAIGVTINNVAVTDCTFKNIKRMGVEFQNHLDETERLFNCVVKNCFFQNLGIGSGATSQSPVEHWGQAVSFSGRGRGHVIDNNTIDNPYAIAIEVTGGSPNTQITNNTFLNCNRSWTELGYKLSLISLAAADRQGVNLNCIVRLNKCIDSSPETGVFFDQILNCDISDNVFPVASWVTIQRAQNNSISRNTIVARGYYGILMDSNSNPAGLIFNNLFEDNIISKNNANPNDDYSTIRLTGGGTYNNLFSGGSLAGAHPFDQINGAARSYLQYTLLNGQETTNDPMLNTYFTPNIISGVPNGFRLYNPSQTQPTSSTDYAYGAQNRFSFILGCTTPLTFNDNTFGDPLPGKAKQFYSRRQKYNPLYTQGNPNGFIKALSSSGSVPLGPNHLAYGTDGKYVYRFNVSDADVPPFTDNPFGDAAPGSAKSGYYRNTNKIVVPAIVNGLPNGFSLYDINQPRPTTRTDYAYGAEGKFSFIFGVLNTDSINFNDSTFGDPLPGRAKKFYSRQSINNPVNVQGVPDGFARAIGRIPAGPNHIAYGANGKFVFRFNVADTEIPPITDNPFGDPAPGTAKAGYYINSTNIIS